MVGRKSMKQTDESKMTDAEKMVADYLERKGYTLLFQPKVSIVDEGDRDRLWYPDFQIKKLGLYVEVCGADRYKDYQRRMEIYRKNKIPIILVETFKDEYKWKYYLDTQIQEYKKEKITKALKKMRWEIVVVYGSMTLIFITSSFFYSTEIWFGRGVIPIYGFFSVLLLFIYIDRWTKLEQEI